MFSGCASLPDPCFAPMCGRVSDHTSGLPIEGATITIEKNGTQWGIGHGRTVVLSTYRTVTDSNGYYRLPAWVEAHPGSMDSHNPDYRLNWMDYSMRVEKEGYRSPQQNLGNYPINMELQRHQERESN